jgi:hypothetical protein
LLTESRSLPSSEPSFLPKMENMRWRRTSGEATF